MRSRLMFLELRVRALDERSGAILWPLVVPWSPRINWSTRIPWGLYEVQLRVRSPSKWFTVFFQFGGRPGEVTGEAFHALLGMRQSTGLGWHTAPGGAVLLHGLGQARLLVVVPGLWVDAIHHLPDLPFQIFRDRGAL